MNQDREISREELHEIGLIESNQDCGERIRVFGCELGIDWTSCPVLPSNNFKRLFPV